MFKNGLICVMASCKKILFIDKNPYGILIDTYKYCQYLQMYFDITYVCIDYGYPKVKSENVTVKYVPFTNYKLLRGILFTLLALYNAIMIKGFIFVSYYPGCGILKKIAFWKKMHVDIRTLSVSPDNKERERWDFELNRTICKFDSVSLISEGVKDKLSIPNNKNVFVIPLGADIISNTSKDFAKLNLLYIGTLNNRRILDTVVGFHSFINKHPNISAHYIIIGDGEEFSSLKQYISDFHLESRIELKGRIPYNELKPYFDNCNIGVSYVPITDYYQYQPPTKTFEYVMSGLYCIATNTYENKKIIKNNNGCLHDDNPAAFCEALEYTLSQTKKLKSGDIRSSLVGHTWKEIVDSCLIPVVSQSYN